MQILESSQLLSMNLWIGLITRQSRRDQYWQTRNHKQIQWKKVAPGQYSTYFSCIANLRFWIWPLKCIVRYIYSLVQHLVKSYSSTLITRLEQSCGSKPSVAHSWHLLTSSQYRNLLVLWSETEVTTRRVLDLLDISSSLLASDASSRADLWYGL